MRYLTKFNKPISPHLSIYLPQINSSLKSIWHRLAGLFLIFSLLFYPIFLKITLFFYFTKLISSVYFTKLMITLLFFFYFSFYFHLTNGLSFIRKIF